MRLQNIEIKGFKSFADRTVVNFQEDIIGIVGPNGCGKSNIVDAIRWVLGEQKSSELRSDKMTNVIFNGTKKRKAGGLAEVSLTFDNDKSILPTEYSSVTVTRILYRSGESEYRINGVSCRLKDIKTLFLDTGIGSDSYAIIALGMVDDLLADRENARRRLFEQAAGISKYKIRKRETMAKLEGTTSDLDRVEDLLFEIEGNLKKLERQAKRAKRYFEMKEEYKGASLDLAIFELNDHKAAYKKVETQLRAEEDRLVQYRAKGASLEAGLEKAKNENLEKEKSLNEKQKNLSQAVAEIRNKENDKKMSAQKLSFILQNQENIQKENWQTEEKIEQTEQDIEYYRSEINTEKRVEAALETNLNNAEERLKSARNQHSNVKEELDNFIKTQQILEKSIFSLEKEKAIKNSQIENYKREIVRIEEEIKEQKKDAQTLEAQQKIQLETQQKKELRITQLQEEEEKRVEQLQQTEKLLETVREERTDVLRKLDAKRNEFNLLKSLVENLEGFPDSIKFLSKNKDWNAQAPLLSDIFYCEPAYRVAVENYLEAYLSYYVTQNMDEALAAIQLLDKHKKGKANFFLLDAFERIETLDLQPQLGMVAALDVVSMDSTFQNLGRFLLGNVLIQEADTDFEPLQQDAAVVLSKSGKWVRRKGVLSGGSVGIFEGKRIGRKKNLELLSTEIEDLKTRTQHLDEQMQGLADQIRRLKAADKQGEIQQEKDRLNRLQQEAVSIQTKLENFENYRLSAQKKIEIAERQIQLLQGHIAEFENKLTTQLSENQLLIQRIGQVDASFKTIAEKLEAASQEFNQQNITFIKQQNKINNLQRELAYREKQLRDWTVKLEVGQRNLVKAEAELVEVQAYIKNLDEELVTLYGKKSDQQAYLSAAEEAYYTSKGVIHDLEEQGRKVNREVQQAQEIIEQLKDRFNDLKLKLTTIGERLRIEFDVALNDIFNQEPRPDLVRADLEKFVEQLKNKIATYGEVNPMAMEAFDEMNERFVFIKAQRDDLLQAKATLLQTIQEIEQTAIWQFMEAFERVRDNFKRVFRTLFTESDDCDLILENPEDPLESPIKITAKPKGKRPQTINQLSGGEKTLTATALLFSLYLLKPAPFCIFDEVDAPLDDANISKFNRIIKEFSTDSQFIIVTHNKQTMASVDVIYGVTMEELGVSKVVPVDFRSLNV